MNGSPDGPGPLWSWPGLTWRGRGLRLLFSLPFLLQMETLDVPLVLASAVHDMVSWMATPQADAAIADGGLDRGAGRGRAHGPGDRRRLCCCGVTELDR